MTTTPWLRTNSGLDLGWHKEIFPQTLRQETEFFLIKQSLWKIKITVEYTVLLLTVARPCKKKKEKKKKKKKEKEPLTHKLLSKPNGLAACLNGAYREKTARGTRVFSVTRPWPGGHVAV